MTRANLQLLGKAIKLFREQARPHKISQFRLATLMQWEGTAPVVEIEKGRRLPRPETLSALGEALQLSPADIAYLHGLAGYRELTVMPSLDQIKRVLQSIEPDISQRFYPVYVMDYQFRFWMVNSATVAFGGSLDFLIEAMKHGIDGLLMTFDSRSTFYEDTVEGEKQKRDALFRFKAYNIYRRHEPFYLAYPDCLKTRLLPKDYIQFETLWHEIDVRMQDVYPITPNFVLKVGRDVLAFEIHMVEILHLNHLFFAAYYEPKDDHSGNRERCAAYFEANSPAERLCVKAWDYL
ncbi:MAG: helix-turn-helix transcriptional regulator [Anaerolineae bacterium]